MNKKGFTALVCILSILVFALIVLLFFDVLKTLDTEPVNGTSEENVQTETEKETESEKESETETEKESETETEKEPEKESEKESEKDDTTESTDNQQSASTSSDGAETQPTASKDIKSGDGNYKEFTLLEGMSAKEAYEYLDDFLNSKYSILVNKQNKVSSDYEPTNLRVPAGCDYKLESTAATALEKMMSDAKKAGYYDLVFYSGYRTYASQKNKYETRTQKYIDQGYSRENAEAKAGEYIAPPGSSEHHTGLAADVCSSSIVNQYGQLNDAFDKTKSWTWLSNHCSEYGFIIRYRKGAESITGFSYEPWHFRYIGVEHATACTALGITYEEYYNMLVKYRADAKADAGV